MRRLTGLLLLQVLNIAVVAAHAQSSAQRITPDRHYPGPLETFLNETKSPGLETKVFGSFEGEEKAKVTFKAIVAWDPANPENKLQGLAIELARGDCRHTAYLDVDISKPDPDWFKESIVGLQYIEDKGAIQKDWRGSSVGGIFESVLNGLPPSLRDQGLAETVLNVGWWKPEDRDFVLCIHWSPCRMLLFPKATMTDAIKAMSSAHDYLWSH